MSVADPAAVAEAVRALQDLSIEGLRSAWRARVGGAPPRIRSGDLLRRLLAERLQLAVFGSDPELDRRLGALARAYERRKSPSAPGPELKTGAVLWREYGGESHRVEVLAAGFRWRDQTFRSLSQVARGITGTRWNGPKFFGLREPAA